MNSTIGSEYTENTYIHLKLIFAFAAQSSLSKVRNNNVRNAVRTRRASIQVGSTMVAEIMYAK